jgi:hypothetical protein
LQSGIPSTEPVFAKFLPPLPLKSKLGFDEIYMINLDRRPDREAFISAV